MGPTMPLGGRGFRGESNMLLQPNGTRGWSSPLRKRLERDRTRPALMAALTLAWLCAGSLAAEAQVVRNDFDVTNGVVNATVLSGNTLYIGGQFSRVGPATGG